MQVLSRMDRLRQDRVGAPSAEQIATRTVDLAQSILRDSSYFALRRLRCRYHEGVLSISGLVHSYYMRQIAHKLLKDIEGVEIYSDQNEVAALPSRPDGKET